MSCKNGEAVILVKDVCNEITGSLSKKPKTFMIFGIP